MSMKLQNIFLHLLAFKFLSEQAKIMFLQIFYSRFGAEFTFELWWTHYMLEELGNNINNNICSSNQPLHRLMDMSKIVRKQHDDIFSPTAEFHYLTFSIEFRLFLNVIVLVSAMRRLPEFSGFRAQTFPGQPAPPTPRIAPRRMEWGENTREDTRKSRPRSLMMVSSTIHGLSGVEIFDQKTNTLTDIDI